MSRRKNFKNPAEFISDDLAMIEGGIIISMATEELSIPKPKSPVPDIASTTANGVAIWGESNDFPQDVLERANLDLELLPLLDKKGRLLQGREVIAVNLVPNKDNTDFDVRRILDQEVNDFISSRWFKRYWRESCVDFTWLHNIFPDLVKNADGDKIAQLNAHEASWCRFGTMDPNGTITKCYVSAKWPDAKIDNKNDVYEYPVIDPYAYNAVDLLKADEKIQRCVYPVNYPTPGQAYYPVAPWTKYLYSEWSKIKMNVPKWKLKTMERVLSAKYILVIPTTYWVQMHPDWKTKTAKERQDIKKAKVKEINDNLTGFEGAGSTILNEVGYDNQGKEIPAFKITPIESAIKDGQYLEDSQEASEYMMRSLDLDPTIVGKGPGRGKDAGSGSDKRVAFNILVALLQPYRDVILEPLYFVSEYNGWKSTYPNIRFMVLEVELETLDKSHSTSEIVNPVTPQPSAK
jgi:hypothetical protein